LDLLLISESSVPPVCKLVNYGQFMYQQKKKDKSARRSAQVTKELKMSPKISDNDYNVRLNKAKVFLGKKYKIKLTIFFRGREIMHKDLGEKLAKRFLEEISDLGTSDAHLSRAGRNFVIIISPK
jgi:translation initiation factor IF-3